MAKEISMSKSQSNGITGEMLLPLHLKKFNCIADKCGPDFGFDFDVHVFDEKNVSTAFFFKAQCKEVESGEYKYAKLEEKHMRLYLKTRQVVCIFGVDLEKNCIRHRFFDKELAQKFFDALEKKHSTICLNFETELRPEAELLKDINKYSDQCIQNQLYEFISEKKLQEFVPAAKIRVINDSQGTHLKITSPYITDMVNPLLLKDGLKTEKAEDVIYGGCLGVIQQRYRNFRSIQFGGIATSGSHAKIGTKIADIDVSVWQRRGNIAYMMPCGFSLEFGPCQHDKKNGHFHPASFEIEKSAKPFFDFVDDVRFFETIKSNDALYIEKSPMIPNVSEWELLDTFFKVVKEVIYLKKEIPSLFENFYLACLNDEKYWNNVQVLYQLLIRKNEQYILEAVNSNADYQKNSYHKKIEGVIPIIFSLDNVYRLSFSCCYSLVENNGCIIGVAIGKITNVESETLLNEEKNSFPKVDFSGAKPPIPWEHI